MKKKLFACLLALAAFAQYAMAQDEKQEAPQEEKKGFDKSKLFIGGNFGLNFSSYYTLIDVSPQIGYHFNRYIAAGAGVNFVYSSQKTYTYDPNYYKTNYGVAGINIFGRVYPIQQVLLQLQPELNYTWGKQKYYDGTNRPDYTFNGLLVPSLLVGAGGALPAGGSGAFIIMVQYDLLQNSRAPYGNRPFFSFGYNVGF